MLGFLVLLLFIHSANDQPGLPPLILGIDLP